jgi:predicted nucleic acid-binding protein
MVVISDASPFVALLNIDEVEILPKLFGTVIIPTEVAHELAGSTRPLAVKNFIANPPTWLNIQSPSTRLQGLKLDQGEAEAISLALELKADLLIIDEREGYKVALAYGLKPLHTTALLRDAANRNLLDLNKAFSKLRQTNFRVDDRTLEVLLREHEEHVTRQDPPEKE